MNTRAATDTAGYFDGLADNWDALMPLKVDDKPLLDAAVRALTIRPGDFVLDAGCGTGILFPFLLAAVGASGTVVGLDVSSAMIARARAAHAAPNIRLECADIADFLAGAPRSVFSAVACYQAFPHFADKPAVLAGFHRVLAPGGRFAVFHREGSSSLNAFHATLPPPVNAHRLPAAAELAALARDAGFTVRETQDEAGCYLVLGEKPAAAG